MRYLKCTKKLLDEMEVKPVAIDNSRCDAGPLGDWCVNLLRVDRRKCLLFVNERTLFAVMVLGVKKPHIQNLSVVFRDVFFGALLDEGYSHEKAEEVLSEYNELAYSKTTDRSVLSSMNDHAFRYEHWIFDLGGVDVCDIRAISMRQNRTPMGARKYAFPIELLNDALGRTVT